MKIFRVFLILLWLSPAVFCSSPWGVTVHVPLRSEFDYIEELGAEWVRVDFNWSDIEPRRKGVFNWGPLDAAVEEAYQRGIRVFGTIAYSPGWARSGSGHNSPPVNAADWEDFVYECVSRYSYWVKHWGMWNEPNLPEFWSGGAEEYVSKILIPGAAAVRRADPAAKVLGPELSDRNRLYTIEFFSYVMNEAAGSIDIVTQHAYGLPSSIFLFLDDIFLPLMEEFAPGKELWITETGARSDARGEEYQSAVYRLICEGVEERNYINKVFFYKLVDGLEEEKWGMLDRDYRRKEAFETYRRQINHEPHSAECFVAGAVFGELAPELERLRRFRDDVLVKHRAGRFAAGLYYRTGPVLARAVSASRAARFAVRAKLRCFLFVLNLAGL